LQKIKVLLLLSKPKKTAAITHVRGSDKTPLGLTRAPKILAGRGLSLNFGKYRPISGFATSSSSK